MQKSEIRGLDRSATEGRGKAQATAKHGQKSYSMKYAKESSKSRGRSKGRRAGIRRKRQREQRQTAYKYTSEDVSRIVQKRTDELRNRLNDLKVENEVLREILITSFKNWYEENKSKKEA